MITKEQKIAYLEKLIHKKQIALIRAQKTPNIPEQDIKNIEHTTDLLCSILRDIQEGR